MQSILLNLITLKATSPNWADFLYLVCGAARQLVYLFLRPAFCGSQHGLTNLLSVSLRFFPLLCQLIQVLLSGAQGLELLFRPFLTYFFCGAPRRFLLSFFSFFRLGFVFRFGLCLPFQRRGRFHLSFPLSFLRRRGWLRASVCIWRKFFWLRHFFVRFFVCQLFGQHWGILRIFLWFLLFFPFAL